MTKVSLQKLSGLSDWLVMSRLQVNPDQRKFTESLFTSWIQSRHPAVIPYGAYVNGEPVGFVLLVHAEIASQWIIARLVIDKAHQRKGYAYDICDQLIDIVHDMPDSESVVATFKDENTAARALFAKLKFVETGKEHQGKKVARLDFEFEEVELDEDEEVEEESAVTAADSSDEEVIGDDEDEYEDDDDDEDDEYEDDDDEEEDQPSPVKIVEKVYITQNADIEEYYVDTEGDDDEEDEEDTEDEDSK